MTSPITPQRVALVVDDSKLARYVLKEMLLDLGIKVETAESAEEALGSLSAFKPDVIFMDHMMPGMDGFQAVQAIKSDPKTASIPILMYTSKDEGVYVNQARALGAVGVLPKKLKPVQLQEVLVQLRLVPHTVLKSLKKSGEVKSKETKHENASSNTPVHSIDEAEIVSAKGTQSSLEELARSASEEQEKDSMRLLFRQLFSEQRDSIKQDQWVLLDAMTANIAPIILATRHKIATWQVAVLSGIFILLLSILAVLYNALNIAESRGQVLSEEIKNQEFTLSRIEKLLSNVEETQNTAQESINNGVNVKPIEWAINHNSQRSFTQTLNSESTRRYITELISQLDDFGFNGLMYIQFHSGRFCQQNSTGGLPMLVGAEHSIDKCQFNFLDINQAAVIAEFEIFLAQLALEFPLIKIHFEYFGTQFTLQDYPEISADINAGQWNEIAKKNNRFNFDLVNVD